MVRFFPVTVWSGCGYFPVTLTGPLSTTHEWSLMSVWGGAGQCWWCHVGCLPCCPPLAVPPLLSPLAASSFPCCLFVPCCFHPLPSLSLAVPIPHRPCSLPSLAVASSHPSPLLPLIPHHCCLSSPSAHPPCRSVAGFCSSINL
jgi:hypothetical protein